MDMADEMMDSAVWPMSGILESVNTRLMFSRVDAMSPIHAVASRAGRAARSFLPRSCGRPQVQTVPSPGEGRGLACSRYTFPKGLGSALSLMFGFQDTTYGL